MQFKRDVLDLSPGWAARHGPALRINSTLDMQRITPQTCLHCVYSFHFFFNLPSQPQWLFLFCFFHLDSSPARRASIMTLTNVKASSSASSSPLPTFFAFNSRLTSAGFLRKIIHYHWHTQAQFCVSFQWLRKNTEKWHFLHVRCLFNSLPITKFHSHAGDFSKMTIMSLVKTYQDPQKLQ